MDVMSCWLQGWRVRELYRDLKTMENLTAVVVLSSFQCYSCGGVKIKNVKVDQGGLSLVYNCTLVIQL